MDSSRFEKNKMKLMDLIHQVWLYETKGGFLAEKNLPTAKKVLEDRLAAKGWSLVNYCLIREWNGKWIAQCFDHWSAQSSTKEGVTDAALRHRPR